MATLSDFLLARYAEDPAVVIRALVAAHRPEERMNRHSWGCGCGCNERPERGCSCGRRDCPTLREITAAFADHPDWREEWAL